MASRDRKGVLSLVVSSGFECVCLVCVVVFLEAFLSCVLADLSLLNKPTFLEYKKGKYLILDSPTDENAQAYLDLLLSRQVKFVVRTCKPTYDKKVFEEANISIQVIYLVCRSKLVWA